MHTHYGLVVRDTNTFLMIVVLHCKGAMYEIILVLTLHTFTNRGDCVVGESVGPASGRLGVRIPTATDLHRKNM